MKTEFNLSDKIIIDFIPEDRKIKHSNFLWKHNVKEFIELIKVKVLIDWKGQNEFIDWLKEKLGDKL